jgi:cellulose synthase/poly-beta-1,6-N-acetylglucosamine synthase-like glycosyltransferase
MPARNESAGIGSTLEAVKSQLGPNDVLLVVADNCTDDTAAVARASGAAVIERQDSARIGKGYALDFGLQHLAKDRTGIVIMIDADCQLDEGTIDQLASYASTSGRPVQALYLMTAPSGSEINKQIAEFAWRVKNWARPLGLGYFNLPCQLMGTGMAFAWQIIQSADLASGSIVEDLKLGLDLTALGHPPLFCPSARVTSQFAASTTGENIQRQRWEHGHIATILKYGPRLFITAVARADIGLLALTLDLVVPPVSLLAILLILSFVVTAVAAVLGFGLTALTISTACVLAFTASIAAAWHMYGRDVLPPTAIASIPRYILRKIGLYRQALLGKLTGRWIGTDRAKL